jgi:hypothetical protein
MYGDDSRDCRLLCKVVRPRECLVAVRANVRSFLSMSANMSTHSMSVAARMPEPHGFWDMGAGG